MTAGQDDAAPDPDQLAERLRLAVGRFVRGVRDEAGTPTTAQAETLGLIARAGARSVASLAQARSVRHQSMRLVVAQLEAGGLVRRTADPADRRSQAIALTDAGRAALAASRDARRSAIATLIRERLSPDERRLLADAVGLLDRLIGPPD